MDGVFVDFIQSFKNLTGREWYELSSNQRWKAILEVEGHQRMFRDAPMLPYAIWLFNGINNVAYIYGCKVEFLTAIPSRQPFPYALEDKIYWVKEYLNSNHPVKIGPFAEHKQLHCRDGDILIDDKAINCQQWDDAGGYAIHFDGNVERTIKLLVEYCEEKYNGIRT